MRRCAQSMRTTFNLIAFHNLRLFYCCYCFSVYMKCILITALLQLINIRYYIFIALILAVDLSVHFNCNFFLSSILLFSSSAALCLYWIHSLFFRVHCTWTWNVYINCIFNMNGRTNMNEKDEQKRNALMSFKYTSNTEFINIKNTNEHRFVKICAWLWEQCRFYLCIQKSLATLQSFFYSIEQLGLLGLVSRYVWCAFKRIFDQVNSLNAQWIRALNLYFFIRLTT